MRDSLAHVCDVHIFCLSSLKQFFKAILCTCKCLFAKKGVMSLVLCLCVCNVYALHIDIHVYVLCGYCVKHV